MPPSGVSPIGCFCHIPKTGGTTVDVLLRRHFGLRHLDVPPRQGYVCDAADLRTALRLRPNLASISGPHGFRPYVDYGEMADRLVWYTILRDPIPRCISNYQHQVERMGVKLPFEQWLRRPANRNWQVRMLSGGQDLEAAKRTLASKIRCLGFLERFDEFMLLLRHRLDWPGMKVAYGRSRNPAKKGRVARQIKESWALYESVVVETNVLDQQLYDFALRQIYPLQVTEYGERRLQADLESEFAECTATWGEKVRELGNHAYRELIYKPLSRVRG